MNEQQFIAGARPFLEWLSNRLDGHALQHSWVSRSSTIGIPAGEVWTCDSLFNAHEQYRWRARCPDIPGIPNAGEVIEDYANTAQCLDWLGAQLIQAIDDEDADTSRQLCETILKWGGVARKPRIAQTLRAQGAHLPAYLGAVRAHFQALDLDCERPLTQVVVNGRPEDIGLDSGTTKIYSLICPGFVIYDGRVGAALGHLVSLWNHEADDGNSNAIPSYLWFGWGDRSNCRRDPKPATHPRRVYPLLTNQDGSRIGHNLRANWLCAWLARHSNGTGFDRFGGWQARMRPLESALFMMGYAVNPP